jgi:hypothetical protein
MHAERRLRDTIIRNPIITDAGDIIVDKCSRRGHAPLQLTKVANNVILIEHRRIEITSLFSSLQNDDDNCGRDQALGTVS